MNEKNIKVMAEFCSEGIWWDCEPVSIDDFKFPPKLIQRLDAWNEWHDRDNQDYLPKEERTKTFNVKAFSEEGLSIAKDIKKHLGGEWTVKYFDENNYRETLVDRSVYEYEIT